MELDDKVREQTDYLFNQLEVFLEDRDKKDVKRILFKILKVFYKDK